METKTSKRRKQTTSAGTRKRDSEGHSLGSPKMTTNLLCSSCWTSETMDHVASLRAARLLVLQTEGHAAANNTAELQGKATKLHEGGASTGSRGPLWDKETCAGPFQLLRDTGSRAAALEVGPWWRQPLLNLAK